ncbi:hypothetical protein C2845_PM05G11470 [Panicum miliaceum]|uniref:KIB1-4 beta-propeller domain-containing protein n=1 Tax=Panicum miliaceum TaxID=4540 RepID=A0A3L6SWQ4_PANMI|nr:hypothetical protein C2845_PM05G11470 [Panicum miliaceum]
MAASGPSPSTSAAVALPFLVHDVGPEYYEPQAQYSVASQSLVNATIDLLQDHRCFETPQGWVLALDPASLRTFLWRPEDGERIALPDMEEDFPTNWKCVLSDRPGAGFCAVMVLDLERQQAGTPWLRAHHVAEVAVYKMDFSAPAWCKVDRIGDDRVFLLGGDRLGESNFGASCSAGEHGLPGNRIYFLNHWATNENFLHIIDLEKETQEVERPFKDFVDSLRPPFWMLPTAE